MYIEIDTLAEVFKKFFSNKFSFGDFFLTKHENRKLNAFFLLGFKDF